MKRVSGSRVPASGGEVKLEIAVVGIASQDASALEGAADALGQPLNERLQLLLTRRLNSTKHLRLGADEISPVEHDGAKMNIE